MSERGKKAPIASFLKSFHNQRPRKLLSRPVPSAAAAAERPPLLPIPPEPVRDESPEGIVDEYEEAKRRAEEKHQKRLEKERERKLIEEEDKQLEEEEKRKKQQKQEEVQRQRHERPQAQDIKMSGAQDPPKLAFGTPAPPAGGGSPFGTLPPTTTSGPGQSVLSRTATNSDMSSLFGGGSARTGGFKLGESSATDKPDEQKKLPVGQSAFDNSSKTPASIGDGLFGKPSSSNTNTNSGTMFSSTSAGGSGTLFGSNQPLSAGSGVSLFGQASGSNLALPRSQSNAPSVFSSGSGNAGAGTNQPSTGLTNFNTASTGASGAMTPQGSKPAPSIFSTTPAGNPPQSSSIFNFQKRDDNQPLNTRSSGQDKPLFGAVNMVNSGGENSTPSTFSFSSVQQSSNSQPHLPQQATASSANNIQSSAASAKSQPRFDFGTQLQGEGAGLTFMSGQGSTTPSTSAAPSQPTTSGSSLFPTLGQQSSAPGQQISTGSAPPSGPSLFSNLGPQTNQQTNTNAANTQQSGSSLFANIGQQSKASSTSQGITSAGLVGSTLGGQRESSSNSQAPALATTSGPTLRNDLFRVPASSSASQAASNAVSTSASIGNLFGDATSNTTPGSTSAGGLFGGTTTTTAGGGSTLFGAPTTSQAPPKFDSATTTFSTSGAAGTTSTAAPSLSTLGKASLSGPVAPQNSRLAAKSMDEILTMWSTSLSTHQKHFQALAQQVSTWDRVLVQNSINIAALYGRCFQAERDCSEVERQLRLVENEQSEVDTLLTRYETEVDGLLESAGLGEGSGGLAGVDAERERLYTMAESCSGRLNEMGHSLTDMIESINEASSKLSSSASNVNKSSSSIEDPLSQIVRVLNADLVQLQTIDAGAGQLQERVAAAQREARVIGEAQTVTGRNGWVEEFGRSYLGTR